MGVWQHAPSNLDSATRCGNSATSEATRKRNSPNERNCIAITSAGERGERNVALENIVKLAKALSVPPADLFVDFS